MWFLIKTSFWFGLVLVALPFFVGTGQDRPNGGPTMQLSDVVTAVGGFYNYVGGMCGEKPEVCTKGGDLLSALGSQAREGAFIAYRLLDEHFGTAAKPTSAPALAQAERPMPKQLQPLQQALQSAAEATAESASQEAVALNQPMPNLPKPYRPPVVEDEQAATTGTIPLPMPRPTQRTATR